MRRFLFPVEAGLVLEFARAIDDPDPVYRTPDFAKRALEGAIIPPPTFLMASGHFDPECRLRPNKGEVYRGSGPVSELAAANAESRPKTLHAEQRFDYFRPPRIGEMLTVEVRPGKSWEKQGANGPLRFDETLTDYTAADGEKVASACWLRASFAAPPQAAVPAAPREARPVELGKPLPLSPLGFGDLAPGDRWSAQVVENLAPMQFVTYAAAAGDFVPLHYDGAVARAVGHPGIFAQGMLTMALSGRVLSAVVRTERLSRFAARMKAVVYPGDSLTATVAVEALHPPAGPGEPATVDLALTTVNQAGAVVLTATAAARLA